MDDLILTIESLIRSVEETELTIGIQATEGAERLDGGALLIEIAQWNHWGTRTIPARPWLLEAQEAHGDDWLQAWADALQELADTGDTDRYLLRLRQLGVVAVADAQAALTDLRDPPNAAGTVRRKGSDNPLIDTGHLRNMHRAIVTFLGESQVVG